MSKTGEVDNSTIAVVVTGERVTNPDNLPFNRMQIKQVRSAKEVDPGFVILVEDRPSHPAYNELRGMQAATLSWNMAYLLA